MRYVLLIIQSFIMRNPINTEPDGSCKTIKAQYYKNGVANFIRGGHYGATGVIEYYEQQCDRDWQYRGECQ